MRPTIIIIAAMGLNGELGMKGPHPMPWKLRSDLRLFKAHTEGHMVVMGRHTWESIGKKPLPNRLNIVLSKTVARDTEMGYPWHDPNFRLEGSLREALLMDLPKGKHLFVIGGAQLFTEAIGLATEMRLTRIEKAFPQADLFFPKYDPRDWVERSTMYYPAKPENGDEYGFHHQTLTHRAR